MRVFVFGVLVRTWWFVVVPSEMSSDLFRFFLRELLFLFSDFDVELVFLCFVFDF